MSVLGDVFNSLQAMNQWQLLLAFVACTAYVLAQGDLVSPKVRRMAWSAALLSTAVFVLESAEWMYSAMLAAFAIAGLGLFVASAWILSRALGFSKPRATAEAAAFAESVEAAEAEVPVLQSVPVQASLGARTLSQHSGPAHST